MIDAHGGFTPTPVISHAILGYNRGRHVGLADGIVVTPSHNPPADGGFKYNSPNGGPADTEATSWIERKANELLSEKMSGVKRIPYERALKSTTCTAARLRNALRDRSCQHHRHGDEYAKAA